MMAGSSDRSNVLVYASTTLSVVTICLFVVSCCYFQSVINVQNERLVLLTNQQDRLKNEVTTLKRKHEEQDVNNNPHNTIKRETCSCPPGPAGPQGPPGLVGPTGAPGPQGSRGARGAPGPYEGPTDYKPYRPSACPPACPPGPPGLHGYQGEAGVAGPPGPPGYDGAPGRQGATGPPGPLGRQGTTGPPGQQGVTGPLGPTGPPGPTGPHGPTGKPGKDGHYGKDGIPGPPGPLGLPGLPAASGTVYVRWGHRSCPRNLSLVYSGRTAGADSRSSGGGTNAQCLPTNPEYLTTINGTQSTSSSITGAEYESNGIATSSNNHDVPCAVCFSTARTSHMFPAKVTCPDGWTEQYQGYLMSSRRRRSEYLCVDEAFERAGRRRNDNGFQLYLVEPQCKSLSCPPYDETRELACVVCTN